MTFKKNLERDAKMLQAFLIGGQQGMFAVAMLMPEFSGGPDTVNAYACWITSDKLRDYRFEVSQYMTRKGML